MNDANGLVEGLTSAEANVLMHNELVEAMPGTVFSGELINEVSFFRESFAQRAAWEGQSHPVSAFLFGKYTRFYGHLGVPGADSAQRFHNVISVHESQGVLPTPRIWDEHILNEPLTQEILAIAREWQTLGLTPDLELRLERQYPCSNIPPTPATSSPIHVPAVCLVGIFPT